MMDSLKDNVIDPIQHKLNLKRNYRDIFDTDAGKAVLHDLLRECGAFSTSMDTNPNMTAFKEGKRSIALFLQSRLRLDNVPDMMKLLEERHDNRNAQRDSIQAG
jgi:hypothetical protein